MYKNKKIICIIPARGGSKGIKMKNLFPFLNKPLIYHTIEFAKKLQAIDEIIVSTDSMEIFSYSKSIGITYDYLRPTSLSGDFISDKDVIKDVLLDYSSKKGVVDCIVYLQPTSPIRLLKDFNLMIEQFFNEDLDSLWTLSEVDTKYHPLKQIVISDDNLISLYNDEGLNVIARQQLTKTYNRNGVAYFFKPQFILSEQKLMPNKTGYYIIDYNAISIDTVEDLVLAELKFKEVNNE